MASQQSFKTSVAVIAADNTAETRKHISRLKALTPEEFLRVPRKDLEQLSMAQYREVAAAIVPEIDLAPMDSIEPEAVTKHRHIWTVGDRSKLAVLLTVVAMLIAALVGPGIDSQIQRLTLARSIHPDAWPNCSRLSRDVDGCLYRPEHNLNWDYVALALDINEAALKTLNTHLPDAYAPAGEKIIVWRHLGKLEH